MNDGNYFDDADQLSSEGLGTRDSQAKRAALALIKTFEARNRTGLWPQINRKLLIAGLRDRVRYPNHIDQSSTNLCGVVTVMRAWAFDFPVQYVQMAIDLYEKGQANMIGNNLRTARMVQPPVDLRHAAPPNNMNHADWIIAASVRQSLNNVFDYTPGEGIFAIKAWSFPSDVERELKTLGYSRVINKAGFVATSGYDNLMEASKLYQSGWRVLLLIDAGLLSAPIDPQGPKFGEHWVGLNSAIVPKIGPGVPFVHSFNVWSWGRPYRVPGAGTPLPLSTVTKHYFGFVAGRF